MSSRARTALAILLLVALGLDFLFYTGFFASDDLQYLTGARKVARVLALGGPGSAAPGMGNSRLGITVPAGFVYWLTGGSVAAVAWFHVLYHLALVGLAFALGRLFHGERAGLIAAAIAATSPIFYAFAGAILPDNPTACWLGVILFLLEIVRRREEGGPLGQREALRWYVPIGLLFGLAYSCKDTALVMTVPAAACVIASAGGLRHPAWIRNGAFMIGGLLGFLLLEALALRALMGTWVFRPSMVAEVGDVFVQRMQVQGGANPLARLWFAVGDRLSSWAPITIWLLLAGAAGYAFTAGRRLSLLLFFWWPFLYMTIGTTSFTAYRPSTIQTRYYAIVILPAAVMTAAAAQELWRRWSAWSRAPAAARGRLAVALVVVLAVACAGVELRGNAPRSGNLYKSPFVRALGDTYRRALESYPQYPIVIGSRHASRVRSVLDPPDNAPLYFADREFPEPPYLVVGIAGDGAPADPRLEVELLETVRPARSRFDLVAHEVARLFRLSPDAGPRPHPIAGTLERVTRADAQPVGAALPAGSWNPLRGSPRQRPVSDGGAMLTLDAHADVSLQLFDRGGTYRLPPVDPRGRLAAPGPRIRLALPVRLLAGNRARVLLHGFGYDAAGSLADHDEVSASLALGAAPTVLAVDLAAEGGIQTVRVRLRIQSSAAGAVFVGRPTVAPL